MFNPSFLYTFYNLSIIWLKPWRVRTLIPGTRLSRAPLPQLPPPVRVGVHLPPPVKVGAGGRGGARVKPPQAGLSSLITLLRQLPGQLGAIPSPTNYQQCIPISIIMHLTMAIKGLLCLHTFLKLVHSCCIFSATSPAGPWSPPAPEPPQLTRPLTGAWPPPSARALTPVWRPPPATRPAPRPPSCRSQAVRRCTTLSLRMPGSSASRRETSSPSNRKLMTTGK